MLCKNPLVSQLYTSARCTSALRRACSAVLPLRRYEITTSSKPGLLLDPAQQKLDQLPATEQRSIDKSFSGQTPEPPRCLQREIAHPRHCAPVQAATRTLVLARPVWLDRWFGVHRERSGNRTT